MSKGLCFCKKLDGVKTVNYLGNKPEPVRTYDVERSHSAVCLSLNQRVSQSISGGHRYPQTRQRPVWTLTTSSYNMALIFLAVH